MRLYRCEMGGEPRCRPPTGLHRKVSRGHKKILLGRVVRGRHKRNISAFVVDGSELYNCGQT
jgi:hypothetical protein